MQHYINKLSSNMLVGFDLTPFTIAPSYNHKRKIQASLRSNKCLRLHRNK